MNMIELLFLEGGGFMSWITITKSKNTRPEPYCVKGLPVSWLLLYFVRGPDKWSGDYHAPISLGKAQRNILLFCMVLLVVTAV